jgi:uncharacterized small protein (DUF1192 family)
VLEVTDQLVLTVFVVKIGISVDTMQSMHTAEHSRGLAHIGETVHTETAEIDQEIDALREEIRRLRVALDAQKDTLGGPARDGSRVSADAR